MKKLTAMLLTAAMAAGLLAGCSESSPSAEGSTNPDAANSTAVDEQPEATSALPETLENANLTIVWDMTEEAWEQTKAEDPNAFNLVWTTKEEFEKKYGGTVEIIGVGWGEQRETVISMVNSGEVCDLAQAHDQNFPVYGAKHIVQDVSQYFDLNDSFWNDSITKAFTFAGVPYAIGCDANPVVISYNKTLFEQNGIKTPMEYYEEGNWTWDTFRQVAMDMTGDTDGDGENDVYGFGWWDGFYVQMLGTNGVTPIDYANPDGVKSNYQTPEALETFEFLQKGYTTDKYIMIPDGDKFVAAFKSGKLAMTCEYGFGAITAYDCDYEIAWAPLPTGPSGNPNDCGGGLGGFVIPVTATNPEGAAAFVRMAFELEKERNTPTMVEKYGQDQVDLMNKLAESIYFSPIGIEKYWDANWTLFSGMRDGTPVSTFTQTADELIVEGAKITLEQ